MLLSVMLATGMCLTRRAYADLGLSRSAASCAAFCVSTGSSVNCFLVLLLIWLLSLKKSCTCPDWNRLRQRETTWLMLGLFRLDWFGGLGLGPRTSRSKRKGSFQMGVGSKLAVDWRELSDACLWASMHASRTEWYVLRTRFSRRWFILVMRVWRKVGGVMLWCCRKSSPSVQ